MLGRGGLTERQTCQRYWTAGKIAHASNAGNELPPVEITDEDDDAGRTDMKVETLM